MDPFEVVVQGELFRLGERTQPHGGKSYDFDWLNGPADGTYGFTVAPSRGQSSAKELITSAREFVEAFYGPGGIGEADFPNHVAANAKRDEPGPLR